MIMLHRILSGVLLPLAMASCVSADLNRLVDATARGFSREIEDPAGHGVLKRISPAHIDVREKYSVSPNGHFIVFSGLAAGNKTGVRNLWKIPLEGGAPIRLTSGTAHDSRSPSYTSDGHYIVYETGGKIWKIRNDGAGGRQRIPGSGTGYDVFPDVSLTNRVVFCSAEKSGNPQKYLIWTCEMDGAELTQLREGSHPMWSPDGLKIAFEYQSDIWLINADGTNMMQLTTTEGISEGLPSFSPSGRQIVYASNEGPDGNPLEHDFNIWHMSRDGSEKVQFTELYSWDSWPLWTAGAILFLSARGSENASENRQRIWSAELR